MKILSALSVLWCTFARYRRYIAVLVVLGFFGAIVEGIGINAAIPLISFLISGGAPTDVISRTVEAVFHFFHVPFTFRYLLGFIVALFIVRAVTMVAFGYVRGWISSNFLSTKSKNLLHRTFSASWPFLLRQKLGHVQYTLTREIQNVGSLLEGLGQVIQSFTGFFMYLMVALNISPTVTLSALTAGAALLLLARPFVKRMHRSVAEIAYTEKQLSHFLGEHVLGMKVIKAAGAESVAYSYSKNLFNRMRDLSLRLVLVRSLSTSFFQPFAIFFVIVLFAVTYDTPGFNFVAFAATLYLIQKIFVYLESGQNSFNSIVALLPYARSLEEFGRLLDEHKEAVEAGTDPFVFEKSLQFNNVSLTYQRADAALKKVSFTLRRGQTVGLIGPSGAGKTTVADLLLRLFEPTSGELLLDGKPLSRVSLGEWRKRIGYVAQDAFLLNGTIRENIRFYSELSGEDVVAAAKQANIYDFIMTLPEQFDTMVGDRGVMLSGGQRQRVVLARAIARRPALLILDEATSALDSESERLIQEAIAKLHGSVTVFIIAHRLSTIEHADTILVLKDGVIAEQGSPAQLRKNPDSYFVRHGAAS